MQLTDVPESVLLLGSALIREPQPNPFSDLEPWAVVSFPRFEFAKRDVKRAGETIAGDLVWNNETEPKIREAFSIANSWRDSHIFPMVSIRHGVIYYMGANRIAGTTVARLKRMQAIRRKLNRLPGGLNQIQDLGGCRAIVADVSDVSALVNVLRERSRHDIHHEKDYIKSPKPDGYRSHHMIFSFRGKDGSQIYDGRRVELQVRTRLQHSWATAVEAVGLFRGEYLKGNQGSEDWLRLFGLMSAEFAEAEGCEPSPDMPNHSVRVSEIKQLEKKLGALNNLDKLAYTVRFTDISVPPSSKPTYYIIRYNNATNEVDVETYFAPKEAALTYDSVEFLDKQTDKENVVLVEADKLESLKAAYPNYFGDVQLFRAQLRHITRGEGVKVYKIKPQQTVNPRPGENPDITWLRRRHRWNEGDVIGRNEKSRFKNSSRRPYHGQ